MRPSTIGRAPRANYDEAMITYRMGNDLDLDQMRQLYDASTLGERRPVDQLQRFEGMLKHANLIITAWDENLPVGIARALTDFAYVTYLADLAVRQSHQKQGIGVELIRRTRQAAPQAKIVLFAAPAAEGYYPRIGFTHHPQGWVLRPEEPLPGASLQ